MENWILIHRSWSRNTGEEEKNFHLLMENNKMKLKLSLYKEGKVEIYYDLCYSDGSFVNGRSAYTLYPNRVLKILTDANALAKQYFTKDDWEKNWNNEDELYNPEVSLKV